MRGEAGGGIHSPDIALASDPGKNGENMKSGSGVVASITSGFVALLLVSQMWGADAILYDAKIPISPNSVIAGSKGKLGTPEFKQALQMGFGLFADTMDAPKTLVAWYREHLAGGVCSAHRGGGLAVHGGRERD